MYVFKHKRRFDYHTGNDSEATTIVPTGSTSGVTWLLSGPRYKHLQLSLKLCCDVLGALSLGIELGWIRGTEVRKKPDKRKWTGAGL